MFVYIGTWKRCFPCDRDRKMAGYLGIGKQQQELSNNFLGLLITIIWCLSQIMDFCRTCHECQIQGRHNNAKASLVTVPLIHTPFSWVYWYLFIDIIGPIPTTDNENVYILPMIDYATKNPDDKAITNVKSETEVGNVCACGNSKRDPSW